MLSSLWIRPDFSAMLVEPGTLSLEVAAPRPITSKGSAVVSETVKVVSGKKSAILLIAQGELPLAWKELSPSEHEELCDLVIRNKPVTYARLGARSESKLHALEKAGYVQLTHNETPSMNSRRVKLSGVIAEVTDRGRLIVEEARVAYGSANLLLLQEVLREKARRFRSREGAKKAVATKKRGGGPLHAQGTVSESV